MWLREDCKDIESGLFLLFFLKTIDSWEWSEAHFPLNLPLLFSLNFVYDFIIPCSPIQFCKWGYALQFGCGLYRSLAAGEKRPPFPRPCQHCQGNPAGPQKAIRGWSWGYSAAIGLKHAETICRDGSSASIPLYTLNDNHERLQFYHIICCYFESCFYVCVCSVYACISDKVTIQIWLFP